MVCLSAMLVQLIMAEGSVLCGAGVVFLRGQGEDFSNDHLAVRERERERERKERERQTDRQSGCAASSNLNLNLPSYVDQTQSHVCSPEIGKKQRRISA